MNIDRYILWGLMAAMGVCVVMLATTPAKANGLMEVQMPIHCGDVSMIEGVLKDAGREIAWVGRDKYSTGAAFIAQHPKTGDWTFYTRMPDDIACIIISGEKGEFVDIPEAKGY